MASRPPSALTTLVANSSAIVGEVGSAGADMLKSMRWKGEVLPAAYQIAETVSRSGGTHAAIASDLMYAAARIERAGAVPASGYRTPDPATLRPAAASAALVRPAAAAPIRPATVPAFLTPTRVPYAQPADATNGAAQAVWGELGRVAADLNRLKGAALDEFTRTGTISGPTNAQIAAGEQAYKQRLAAFKQQYITTFGGNATAAAVSSREKIVKKIVAAPVALPPEPTEATARREWESLQEQRTALIAQKSAFERAHPELAGTEVNEESATAITGAETDYNAAVAAYKKKYVSFLGANRSQAVANAASAAAEKERSAAATVAEKERHAAAEGEFDDWTARDGIDKISKPLLPGTPRSKYIEIVEPAKNALIEAYADPDTPEERIRELKVAYTDAVDRYKKEGTYASTLNYARGITKENRETRNEAAATALRERQVREAAEARFNEGPLEKISKPLTPGTPRTKYIELIKPARDALIEAYADPALAGDIATREGAYTDAVGRYKKEGTYASALNYARGITKENREARNTNARLRANIDAAAGVSKPSPPLRIFTSAVAAYVPVQETYDAYKAAFKTDRNSEETTAAATAYRLAVEKYNLRADVAAGELKKEADAFEGIAVPWRPVFPSFRNFYDENLAPDSAKYRAVIDTYKALLTAKSGAGGDPEAAEAANEAARTTYLTAIDDYNAITEKNKAEKSFQKEAEVAIEKPMRKPIFPAARKKYTDERIDDLYGQAVGAFVAARRRGVRDPLASPASGGDAPTIEAKTEYDAALARVKERLEYKSTANYLRNIPVAERTRLDTAAAAEKAAKAAEKARGEEAKKAFSYVEPPPRGPHQNANVEAYRKVLEIKYAGLLSNQQAAQRNATTRADYKAKADKYAADLATYKAFANKPTDPKYTDLKNKYRLINQFITQIGDGTEKAASHPSTALYPAREAYLRRELDKQSFGTLVNLAGEYRAENAATKGPARTAVLEFMRNEALANLHQGSIPELNRALNTLAPSRTEFQAGGKRKTRQRRRIGRKTRRRS